MNPRQTHYSTEWQTETQKTRSVEPVLVWCRASVADGGSTLAQHWIIVSCLTACAIGVSAQTQAERTNWADKGKATCPDLSVRGQTYLMHTCTGIQLNVALCVTVALDLRTNLSEFRLCLHQQTSHDGHRGLELLSVFRSEIMFTV